jgi:hypothetical protein
MRRSVGQVALALRPNVFVRIELRGIRREAVHVKVPATVGEVLLHQPPAMYRTTVPQQNDWSMEVVLQVAQKVDDLDARDVRSVKTNIQAQPAANGRNSEGGDCGDAISAVTVVQPRRFASRRPRSSNRWDEEKAAFVYKCEIGAQPTCFFLICGHCFFFHSSMAASSRCVAFRSGF